MKRLVVVSNRLPVTIDKKGKTYQIRTSSGGLVSALHPVIQRLGGCWIGSADHPEARQALDIFGESEGFHLAPVFMPPNLRDEYYRGFCNEILWPLFHDLQSRCNFEPRYWHSYVEANTRFSQVITSLTHRNDIVWVHDYHLMVQGSLLSRHLDRRRLVYFHHIPFPPPDVFEKLPWRRQILESLLRYALVGFQSVRDRHNFVACVRRILPDASLKRRLDMLTIEMDDAETTVGTFPIGIDFTDFNLTACTSRVIGEARNIRERHKDCRLIMGLDRLDYTKGILERIKGFELLLERYPGLHGRVVLTQIAIPSREGISEYALLKEQVGRMVESVNHRFADADWIPINYLNRHLSRAEVVAYYQAADVALITPLKDGMNLVSKEFCASRVDETGVLILSEFAGAAHQLKTGAVLVNPYDAEGIATAVYHALEMDPRDISRRMRRMRKVVRTHDVFAWCNDFLSLVWTSGLKVNSCGASGMDVKQSIEPNSSGRSTVAARLG